MLAAGGLAGCGDDGPKTTSAAKGEPVPGDGYGGAYIAEIAEAVLHEAPDVLKLSEPGGNMVLPAIFSVRRWLTISRK